jgi:hypothetical protein
MIALVAVFICRQFLHLRSYPYGLYLFPSITNYMDLWGYSARFRSLHSVAFFSPGPNVFAYPPAVAPFYGFFFLFPHSTTVFLLFCGCVVLLVGILFARALSRHGLTRRAAFMFTLLSAVLSYPLYFAFNRGNTEILVWLISAAGIYALLKDRPWLGALLIGIASAMKLFPFIYFGLLVSRRQYRQAIFGLMGACVATLASLWLICPNLRASIAGTRRGLAGFTTSYSGHYQSGEIGVDHSLFGLLKRYLGVLPGAEYAHLLNIYFVVAAVLGLAAYFLRIRHLPLINQVLCLAIACILLPPTSFDYTLLHLYTPWALCVLLVVDSSRAEHLHGNASRIVPGLAAIFVCFAILMSQIGEIILHGDRLGGQIKAVTLIVLFVLALKYPLRYSDATADASPVASN